MGALCSFLCGSRVVSGEPRSGTAAYHLHFDSEPRDSDLPGQLTHGFLTIRKNILFTDALFLQAETQLSDALGTIRLMFRPRLKKTIAELRIQLRLAHKEYHSLVWLSREQAGEAQALATDFVQVCIPRLRSTNVSLAVKLDELSDYQQFGSRLQESRKNLNDKLETIIDGLRSIEHQLEVLSMSLPNVIFTIERIFLEMAGPSDKASRVDSVSVDSLMYILSLQSVDQIRETKYYMDNMAKVTDPFVLAPLRSTGIKCTLSAISLLSYVIYLDIQNIHLQLKTLSAPAPVDTFIDLKTIEQVYSFLIAALHEYQVAV